MKAISSVPKRQQERRLAPAEPVRPPADQRRADAKTGKGQGRQASGSGALENHRPSPGTAPPTTPQSRAGDRCTRARARALSQLSRFLATRANPPSTSASVPSPRRPSRTRVQAAIAMARPAPAARRLTTRHSVASTSARTGACPTIPPAMPAISWRDRRVVRTAEPGTPAPRSPSRRPG